MAASPAFPTLTHTAKFLDDPIAFHVLALGKSLWIWAGPAGSGSATMPNLTVSVNFSEAAAPSASTLFGATISNPGELVARRLATKFPEIQFFVTLALDESNELLASWAERQLHPLVARALASPSETESRATALPESNVSR